MAEEVVSKINLDKITPSMALQRCSKMSELRNNVRTLLERVQDLINEDPDLLALFDVSFVCSMRSSGSADLQVIAGSSTEVLKSMKDIMDSIKDVPKHTFETVREKSSKQEEEN